MSSARNRSIVSRRPGYGRTSPILGLRMVKLAAKASRSSAPATSSVSRSLRVSETASVAIAGREGVAVQEREAFLRRGLEPVEEPVGEVGHGGEIGLSDRAEHADAEEPCPRSALATIRSASSGRTPAVPRAKPFARCSMVGADHLLRSVRARRQTRWFRIQLAVELVEVIRVPPRLAFGTPTPVVRP